MTFAYPGTVQLPIDLQRADIDYLRPIWTKMALAVATHRYFLHIDPILSGVSELENGDRATLVDTHVQDPKSRDRKLRFLLRAARSVASEGNVTLVGNGRNGLVAVTVPLSDAGDVSIPRESWYTSEYPQALVAAWRVVAETPLRNIAALGARLFHMQDQSEAPLNASLFGLVILPTSGGVQEFASAIAGAACRNLFMSFLLAREMEAGQGDTSVDQCLTRLEQDHSTLADTMIEFGARLANSPQSAGEASNTDLISSQISKIDYLPAVEFALALSQSSTRFRKYVEGLGVGQS